MLFATADLHLNHTNIIGFCGRPFRTLDGQPNVEEMNLELIRRWNQVVTPDDRVFVVGDFAFGGLGSLRAFLDNLPGSKVLIRGNHDRHTNKKYVEAGFEYVTKSLTTLIDDKLFRFQHRPEPCPAEFALLVCGHVHERWLRHGNTVNCGVDVWDFQPVAISRLVDAPQTPL